MIAATEAAAKLPGTAHTAWRPPPPMRASGTQPALRVPAGSEPFPKRQDSWQAHARASRALQRA